MDNFDLKKYLAENKLFEEEEINISGGAALLDPSELEGLDLSETILKEKEELNESLTGLVVGGLLAAPKLVEWLGKAIGFISKKFAKKDESEIAEWIEKFAHKWEKLYLKAIIAAVKLTGFAKGVWKDKEGNIDEKKLVTTAKILFVVILTVAGGAAVKSALTAKSAIITALESTFGSIKVKEILNIVGNIRSSMKF